MLAYEQGGHVSDVMLREVTKSFGSHVAIDRVDLDVRSGTTMAVLGPSGCGKTTLLRLIAGFERAEAGSIALGGLMVDSPVRWAPPERRRIGIVPQEGALFPHLNVARNVGYGLSRAGRRRGRVEEVLALVGLTDSGSRMPHELSGGQQQRVAVARALAPRPGVVLLDEPFSALDAPLRTGIRADVVQALRTDGATAILVTHDQAEALSVADTVAVMREGTIVQVATPTTLYRRPRDIRVACFVGDAVVLDVAINGGVASTALGPLTVRRNNGTVPPNGTTQVMLRPEQLVLDAEGTPNATVVGRDYYGHDALLRLRLSDGTAACARVGSASDEAMDAQVAVSVLGEAMAFDEAQ